MAAYLEKKSGMPEQDGGMGNFIRTDEIRVRCNLKIGQIQTLSIRKCMGSHTVAEMSVSMETGSLDIAGQQLNSQPLVIEAEQEEESILLFSGVISRIHIDRESDYETVYIAAYSLSWLMDLEKKDRSYQGDVSILELIRRIGGEHSFSILSSIEDKRTEKPFIQYRETDWEFIVRLSSHLHVPVYAADDHGGREIHLGLRGQGTPLTLKAVAEKMCMEEERARQVNFDREKAVCYEVTTGQVLQLGKSVRYHDRLLLPFQADMVLQHGMLYCTYKLAGPRYFTIPSAYNPRIKGAGLEGTVLERKNETIKVHLDIDEEQDISSAYYYPWLPEHGNMMYCMPENGSRIRLLVAGEDERDAIGIHCVRRDGGSREAQNPANRWFVTDEDKKLVLQPSFMELSGAEGKSKISVMDNIGSSISSSGEISIQAKGRILMQGTKVNLSAPGEITAVKRELGTPAIVNICHHLDAMGKQTAFYNLEEPVTENIPGGGRDYSGGQAQSEEIRKKKEEEKKKLQFKLQELLRQENERNRYELGASIVKVISAIPQCMEQDRFSQIALGFRPISGRMKGE